MHLRHLPIKQLHSLLPQMLLELIELLPQSQEFDPHIVADSQLHLKYLIELSSKLPWQ